MLHFRFGFVRDTFGLGGTSCIGTMQCTLQFRYHSNHLFRIQFRRLFSHSRFFFLRISESEQLLVRLEIIDTEGMQQAVHVMSREHGVLIRQIHEVGSLTEQRTLLIGHHARQTRTLEQVIHQQMHVLQRTHLRHLARRITVHEFGLDKSRTHEDGHLLHAHRQTDSGCIGQLTHLHGRSRGLHGIQALKERHNGYSLDTHLRHGHRVAGNSQRGRIGSDRSNRLTREHYRVFLNSRSTLSFRITRSTLSTLIFRLFRYI